MEQSEQTDTIKGYRCQFCGETSPVNDWKGKGHVICPKCGREYDWLREQDDND